MGLGTIVILVVANIGALIAISVGYARIVSLEKEAKSENKMLERWIRHCAKQDDHLALRDRVFAIEAKIKELLPLLPDKQQEL